MSSELYDVIVVGAGIQGSATARELSERKCRVLLLEQFPVPHSRGSSHGQSRITRKSYPQPFYTHMMVDCTEEWDRLASRVGQTLVRKNGYLCIGKANGVYLEDTKKAMDQYGASYTELSPSELARKYPMLTYPADTGGILDPEGGILMADKALMAFQKVFQENGGRLLDGTKVTGIVPGDVIVVSTNKGDYRGKSLVFTAGPWTNELLKFVELKLPLEAIKILVCYWPEKEPGSHGPELLPTFSGDLSHGGHAIYCLPSLEYPGNVKLCLHYGPNINPDFPDSPDRKWVIALIQNFIRDHCPGLQIQPSVVEPCIYTNTPDRHFILDRHPVWKNIVVGAGFSGHGFKLSPAVGTILADLVLGQNSKYDITPFRMSRFSDSTAEAKL